MNKRGKEGKNWVVEHIEVASDAVMLYGFHTLDTLTTYVGTTRAGCLMYLVDS